MSLLIWITIWFATLGVLAVQQYAYLKTIGIFTTLLVLTTALSAFSWITLTCLWVIWAGILFLNANPTWRRNVLMKPLMQGLQAAMPTISETEKIALEAGNVWWEGQLFQGEPDWKTLFHYPKPQLTEAERAFLEGPVETVCQMTEDWHVTHERYDLPPAVWDYLKQQSFFGLTIPKAYGGLGFSAFGHSEITAKLASRSTVLSTTVTVPNSLGPAELLLQYGTETQKQYYLPRLASGVEIPAFALTHPEAGSDASKIPDTGVICYGTFEGKKTLGIRLNWNKRYITLAPIATLLGLAFQCHDPEGLLGGKVELGITCALIPTHLPGIQIGRRHLPANICFQNGPTQGKDVFIPFDYLIGGAAAIGQGWRMLMECLSCGRAISLPASGAGGARFASLITGAYCRIREQFNQSILAFEGIQEALGRIAYKTYIAEATRTMTAFSVNCGEKPSVASAIAKCHVTELSRQIALDAMDIHGGKAVMMGPKNPLGRGFQGVPISITVEGANILTRSMIIFGQGAIRCHPYLYRLFEAIQDQNIVAFEDLFWKQLAWSTKMATKSLWLGLTNGRWSQVSSTHAIVNRYCQQLNRAASAFAWVSHISLLLLGGKLKFKESLSARLGDLLSFMYMASCCLKRFQDQGAHEADLILLRASLSWLLSQYWQTMELLLDNFPIRWVGWCLKRWVMPLGRPHRGLDDTICQKAALILTDPNPTRQRLTANVFLGQTDKDYPAQLEHALILKQNLFYIENKIKQAQKAQHIHGTDKHALYADALQKGIITMSEFEQWQSYKQWHDRIVAVDDFSDEELTCAGRKTDTPFSMIEEVA